MSLTENQVANVVQNCLFESMKNNKMTNQDMWLFDHKISKFIRKEK